MKYFRLFIIPILALFFQSFTEQGIMKSKLSKNIVMSFYQDTLIHTKKFKKNGMNYEEDYKHGKITECRIYWGSQLAYISPIKKDKLSPSIIRLKSGNDFISESESDTLEIINSQIPPMNFGIKVEGATISLVSEKVYLIKAQSKRQTNQSFAKVYIGVYQEMNPKLLIPTFISDSAKFEIH